MIPVYTQIGLLQSIRLMTAASVTRSAGVRASCHDVGKRAAADASYAHAHARSCTMIFCAIARYLVSSDVPEMHLDGAGCECKSL